METVKFRIKQSVRKKEDPDESRYKEMLELYTMVPPSPHVLRKKGKKKKS